MKKKKRFDKCPRCGDYMYRNNKGDFPKHYIVVFGVWPEGYNGRQITCTESEIKKASKLLKK